MPLLSRKPVTNLLEAASRQALGRRAEEEPAFSALLSPAPESASPGAAISQGARGSFLATCANPACNSGWLHLWRNRAAPVFEGGWNCSEACTRARLQAAVWREMDGAAVVEQGHRHRIPLGLLMLEKGWITTGQLRQALGAQKSAGVGRLGHWLIQQQGVSEQLVTRALGLQWSCPVLPVQFHDAEALTALVPRLFVDAFGALPLRLAAGKLLYLGFEDRLDPVLALAVERMTGLRVESGLVAGLLFRPAHTRLLSATFPPVELIEAVSEPALLQVLSKAVERVRPVQSRLVRAHDCLWLRMWLRPQNGPVPAMDSVRDLICSIGVH
jgi:hypothetical protein